MKQLKVLIIALALLAPQPAQAGWWETISNWFVERKNAALCAVGIGAACVLVYKISQNAGGGRGEPIAEIKSGPITIGNVNYPEGWERTDLLATNNAILKQPIVVYQNGVTCGFCALRDSHNVRLNMEGKPSIPQNQWEDFFYGQKAFIVERREINNAKNQSVIDAKTQFIENMQKENPHNPQIQEAEEARTTAQNNIDREPNRETTNGDEIDALLNRSHEYYGFEAGQRENFYAANDDFGLLEGGIVDIEQAHTTIESNGIFTFFLGSMKQTGANYPSGMGHWISFTIRKLGDGRYEGVATDSLNNNRLDDPQIATLIANLTPSATPSKKPAQSKGKEAVSWWQTLLRKK
jgi:hypothetical protein